MITRIIKTIIIIVWIPFGFTLSFVGLFLFIPLWVVSTIKWIFTGQGLDDWMVDVYCQFFFEDVVFGAINKIVDW